jgi:isopentenyl phosphate kinase
LRLIVGHGSGSFGHVAAKKYRTRDGVYTPDEWRGFAQVAAVAARLNRIVADAFLAEGVPVWSLQPSASARCSEGRLLSLALTPVREALARNLVPLVYGDVALDEAQGGTIISTEQVFAYMAHHFKPAQLVMVGAVDGVFEGDPLREPEARLVPRITQANWEKVRTALKGSHATDVTGGMLAKVEEMVRLVSEFPGLVVQLISGERAGALEAVLLSPMGEAGGTVILWD